MTWFVIDVVLIMLGCLLLGALMAWLLAVALYPTRTEGLAFRRSGARTGDENERVERPAEPYRAEPHRLDDDDDAAGGRDVERDDERDARGVGDDVERVTIPRESRLRDDRAERGRSDGERVRSDGASAPAEPVCQTRSELRSQARKAGRGGRR